jgi:hypothetical protein
VDALLYSNSTYATLTYAGAIPFVACALLPWFGIDSLGPLGGSGELLVTYGLAIVSFLCGTQWAAELVQPGRAGLPLFPISNGIVLASWISALAASAAVALVVQLLSIFSLLAIDARLHRAQGISDHYWKLRQRITGIVAVALLIGILGA